MKRCEHGYGPEGCTYPSCWNAAKETPAAHRCESCGEEERIPGEGIIHKPGCSPSAAKPLR